jgi:tRNA A37 threonylcarbamoyladenosine biosynthesis protein TsaE
MNAVLAWLLGVLAPVGAAIGWIYRELLNRWRTRAVDAIDAAVTRRVNRYYVRYRSQLLAGLRYIDVKGLPTVGFHTPDLEDVFVDVGLDYRAPHQVPDSVLAEISGDRHSLSKFLFRSDRMILAVVGPPGSGKTTLLRHTARRVFSRRRTVPILLYLRDHAAEIVATPKVRLPDLLRTSLGALADDEPSGWFDQYLRVGHCVILLDGLDEVPNQDDRRAVADWVERQTTQYPKNDFVISSRPRGYRATPINGAVVLQVRGFTNEQVSRFVHSWYAAAAQHVSTEDGPEDLLTRLAEAPALADLTTNPLLLTMIANVHLHRGKLPTGRVDLYNEICQVMLWRRQEAKRLQGDEQMEKPLRALAFTMMTRQTRDLPREELPTELAEVSTTGLLIEREAGLYSFAHLTFQEYLAAVHIRDTGDLDVLTQSVDNPWWRETILLYAAMASADPIVEVCLDSGTVAALALAYDIADAGKLSPELRQRLDVLLDSLPEQLQAGVLVTRFVRRALIRTETGWVCARPMDMDIYRMFLKSRDRLQATDIWASDAEAFVQWVNDVTAAEPGYRLPIYAELEDLAARRALTHQLSVWTRLPELWTPPGMDPPNVFNPEIMADHIDEDRTRSLLTFDYVAVLGIRELVKEFAAATRHRRDPLILPAWHELEDRRRRLLDQLHEIRARVRREVQGAGHLKVAVGHITEVLERLDRDLVAAYGSPAGRRRAGMIMPDAPAGALASRLDDAYESVKDLTDAVDRTVVLARTAAMEHEPILIRILALDLDTSPEVLSSLANAVTRGKFFGTSRQFADWTRRVVSLDALADVVNYSSPLEPDSPVWTRLLSIRLKVTVLPVFNRERVIDPATATAVRVAALCLAAETGSDHFLDIAAGVTLLERRADGRSPITETVMLATS